MSPSERDPRTTPVLLAGARTPFGRYQGALSTFSAVDLGGIAARAALQRSGLTGEEVDAVLVGQVVQAGTGQGPARRTAIAAGIGWRAPATTINKICLSGLTSVIDAARLVRCGEADVVLAGGQESMSSAPHLLPRARGGVGFGSATLLDGLSDALTDSFSHLSMGEDTEGRLQAASITRQEQDEVALASHARAAAARDAGRLAEEIVAVRVPQRRGQDIVVEHDEGVRDDTSAASLARLRPAFASSGSITAGNASPLSDGAAFVVVTSEAWARERGREPLAYLGSAGQVAGPDPSLLSQPARAVAAALAREGLGTDDLHVVELNEAFAAVAVQSCRELGLAPEAVNVDGGAIALGHPVGASGARLALHVGHALRRRGGGTGVAALCGGGGQGEALLFHHWG